MGDSKSFNAFHLRNTHFNVLIHIWFAHVWFTQKNIICLYFKTRQTNSIQMECFEYMKKRLHEETIIEGNHINFPLISQTFWSIGNTTGLGIIILIKKKRVNKSFQSQNLWSRASIAIGLSHKVCFISKSDRNQVTNIDILIFCKINIPENINKI